MSPPVQLSEREIAARLDVLKADSERLLTLDAHESLRLAEALFEEATAAGRPDYRALGLMARGDALRNLGRHHDALELLEAAAEEFRSLGDEVGWARTRLGWVWSSHQLGRGATALEVTAAAHATLVRHDQWLRAAGLDLNAAFVCFELARHDEALRLLDRALAEYEQAARADPNLAEDVAIRASKAKANKGRIVALLGRFDEAVRLFEEARDGFAAHGEPVSALRAERFIASIHAGRGEFTRALRVYSEAHRSVVQAGLTDIAVEVLLNMIECYMALNRHVQALTLADDAIAQCVAAGASIETARCRLYAARAHASLGHSSEASTLLSQAADTFEQAGLVTELGVATLERARLGLKTGTQAAAEAAERARALFAEQCLPVHQAQAELVWAWAELAADRPNHAADLARSSLQVSSQRLAWPLTYAAHHVLARCAETGGASGLALDEYDRSIAGLERVQGSLAAQMRLDFLGDKLQLYEDAIDCALRSSESERAFEYLERAKSRALVDYLARNPDARRGRTSSNNALTAELARLREEHNWFYNQLNGYRLAEPIQAAKPDAEMDLIRAAVAHHERQMSELLDRLALEQPGVEELDGHQPDRSFGPPELPDGTVLVEYFLQLQRDSGVAFVVAGGELSVVPIGLGLRDMRRLLNYWQLCLETASHMFVRQEPREALATNARRLMQQLYDGLIRPVADKLTDCERLIVIPFGATHAVPFHALHDGEHYLLENHEVTVCPSSSLLRLCAERTPPAGGRCIAVAYSDGGRLPWAVDEARSIAGLMGGEWYAEDRATRETVMNIASRQRIVHFATHATARLDNPSFGHLMLADGQLSMSDVCNLDLEGALVTLSACETGRASVVGGDEVVGLSRGFLYAGAATLVQSLWRVEDESTANLMRRFYSQLCAGRPAASALRAAQRSLLEDGNDVFKWAPFQLVGSSGEKIIGGSA